MTDFRYILIDTNSVCNNAVHDLALIKMTVPRFTGIGGFLIRYFNSHTNKQSQLEKFMIILNKTLFL